MKQFISLSFFFIFISLNLFGMNENCENPEDSISLSQIFLIKSFKGHNQVVLKTSEKTVQSHDGQNVFVNNRLVEYIITHKKDKIIVKRKILSSENQEVNNDKEIQNLYPNMTATLLSCVLAPKRIHTKDKPSTLIPKKQFDNNNGAIIILDKLPLLARQEDSFLGINIRYERSTEKLCYTSLDSFDFTSLTDIISTINLKMTDRKGNIHEVCLEETIMVKK